MTPQEGQLLFDSIFSETLRTFFWGLTIGLVVRIYFTLDRSERD